MKLFTFVTITRLSAFSAAFSSTAAVSQLVSHPLYPKVDWSRVTQGEYAVVDPNDPHSILYLDATDYVVQTRVSMTSRKKLVVLATPQDKAPTKDTDTTSFNDPTDSKPKASPPIGVEGSTEDPYTFYSRQYRRWFRNPFRWVKRKKIEESSEGAAGKSRLSSMVLISDGNIWEVIGHWALAVHVRLQGLGSQQITRRETYLYVKSLRRILKGRGINYLIAYLKASMFVVNSFLGGSKLQNTWALGIGIRLTNGLPASLPIGVRRAIRSRSWTKIRLWVSIFYMYKAFWGFHKKPRLENIESKPFGSDKESLGALSDFTMYVATNLKPQLEFEYGVNMSPSLLVRKPFMSSKAGPNYRISLLGAFYDTLAWTFKYGLYNGGTQYHSELVEYLKVTGNQVALARFKALAGWTYAVWCFFADVSASIARKDIQEGIHVITNMTGVLKPLVDFLITEKYKDKVSAEHMVEYFGLWSNIQNRLKQQMYSALKGADDLVKNVASAIQSKISNYRGNERHKLRLAKLSLILEPAGKVRVIAIMDWWTQTALIPMHDWLFEVLKKGFLETDATFDQEGAVRKFSEQGYKDLYSFDIKSATDLIPMQLYEAVLGSFLSKEIAAAWAALLTKREFSTPFWPTRRRDGKVTQTPILVNGKTSCRYTRGQPMGALSSWGALAVVHHALVRYAGFLTGDTHYRRYLVLGDDVVIEGKEVAERYKELCEKLGISLSLQKSYISSEGLFNFASQTLVNDINVSPLSFRKELSMEDGFDRLSALMTAVPRGVVDFSTASWLQQLARFVLPRSVYSEMEAQRLKGARHPAIQVLGALLCGATLAGDKSPLWEALTKNGVTLPIRLLLKPGLALFSLKLSELVRGDRRTEFEIQAHKILDRVESLLDVRLMRTREAYLKDLGVIFNSIDGVIHDSEGDILDSTTISLGTLIDVVVKDNITSKLPIAKLLAISEGQALRLLSIPFLATFHSYLAERLRTLYNDARLSRKARERNKILEGEWWKGGFKIDFGLEPRVKMLANAQKDIESMELTPKIVLDMHDRKGGKFSDSILEYLFLGILTERGANDVFERTDGILADDLILESSSAHKEQNHPKTSSSL